jgi:DNA modification methylase
MCEKCRKADEGYNLPLMKVIYHEVEVDHATAGCDRDGQGLLLREASIGLKQASKEKQDSKSTRIDKMMEIIKASPDDHFILWHDLEVERHLIKKSLPEVCEVYGSLDMDIREQRTIDFSEGREKYFSSKESISGCGSNFQYHCHKAIFLGINYKFHGLIQAIHRIYRFLQSHEVEIHIIYTESEQAILDELKKKWIQHDKLVENMIAIIKEYGLASTNIEEKLARTIGIKRQEKAGTRYRAINNDSIIEIADWPDNSIDMYLTSIPFGNHYEYSASYNDLGHNTDNGTFFEQMDYLSPHLLRTLKPGRVYACHVKDRILFGNATGTGMPTVDPFHMLTTLHYIKHGFEYMGMITVITDVVRENNQTYRLGWTENSKDGSKMGVGCPEYILLFRKLPTDTTRAYADVPVVKSKQDYTRARWQIDAHGFWRSSGDRLLARQEMRETPISDLQAHYREWSRGNLYDHEDHVLLAEELEEDDHLPATFMVVAPGSWQDEVWDDVNRMNTMNSRQTQKDLVNHICPLQFDIVERLIRRYSNRGEVIADPFAGLMTVPYVAVKMERKGYGVELNYDYWRDGIDYLEAIEEEVAAPTLFDDLEAISLDIQ